jgi:hypothetical protein
MIEKSCLVAGCTADPSFGFGLSKWVHVKPLWACLAHRETLRIAAKGASGAAVNVALPQETPKLRRAGPLPSPAPAPQGSLL